MLKAVEHYLLHNPLPKGHELEAHVRELSNIKRPTHAAESFPIETQFKRTLFFRELMLTQNLKYQEIISCLAPFSRVVEFRAGDVITVTGEIKSHVFWLLRGEVYIFVPTGEAAYQASIKLHNPKPTRHKNKVKQKGRRRVRPFSPTKILSSILELEEEGRERQLSLIQAYDVIKDERLASELVNSHTYKQLMSQSLKISNHPTLWHHNDIYDECIAVCKRSTACLAVPIEVYEAIQHYLAGLKRKEIVRMTLDAFSTILSYEEVEKFLDRDAHRNTFKLLKKEELRMEPNSYYLILEGEVETEVAVVARQENQDREAEKELPLASYQHEQVAYRKVCPSKKGDIIHNPFTAELASLQIRVVAISNELTRVFKLSPYWLSTYTKKHPELRDLLESVTSARTELILKSTKQQPQSPTKYLTLRAKMPSRTELIKSKRSMDEIQLFEAIRKPLSSEKRRLSESVTKFHGGIEQERNSIKMLVADKSSSHSRIIRKKNFLRELTDRDICDKLGLLSEYQITEANKRILKAKQNNEKWVRDKDFEQHPTISPRKLSLPLLPKEPKMFSKRSQNKYNCQK